MKLYDKTFAIFVRKFLTTLPETIFYVCKMPYIRRTKYESIRVIVIVSVRFLQKKTITFVYIFDVLAVITVLKWALKF